MRNDKSYASSAISINENRNHMEPKLDEPDFSIYTNLIKNNKDNSLNKFSSIRDLDNGITDYINSPELSVK